MQKTDQCCIIENAKLNQKKVTAKDLMNRPKAMKKPMRKKVVSPWRGIAVALTVCVSTLYLFLK